MVYQSGACQGWCTLFVPSNPTWTTERQKSFDALLIDDRRNSLALSSLNMAVKARETPQGFSREVGVVTYVVANCQLIENASAHLEEWRAVASRYEKTAASFMDILYLVAAV